MKQYVARRYAACLVPQLSVSLAACFLAVFAARSAELPQYTLRDYLNRAWENERVTYAVDAETAAALQRGARLLDGAGGEVAWQQEAGPDRIHFIASVPALGESAYRFEPGAATAKTELTVTETAEAVELVNGRTGVRLNKTLADGAGPLAGWRLASGRWVGASRLEAARKVAAYEVAVEARGPVLARATARVRFEDGGTWSLTVELQAGEPLFRIREAFACTPSAGRFMLTLNAGFEPSWILYRAAGQYDLRGGRTRLGQLVSAQIPADAESALFTLEPWVHWQYSLNRGTWFALLEPKAEDALFLGTGDSPCWVDPAIPGAERASGDATLQRSKEGPITLAFDVKRGEREYFLGTLPTEAVMTDLHGKPLTEPGPSAADLFAGVGVSDQEQALQKKFKKAPDLLEGVPAGRLHRSPLPQQLLIKHSDFPLNRAKDMVLEWEDKGGPRSHPRMLVSPEQLAAFRARYRVSEEELKKLRLQIVTPFHLDDLIPAYLATGDAALERRLVDGAVSMLQSDLDSFVTLDADNSSVGVAPHHRRLVSVVNLIDAVLSSERLTAEQRRALRGQLAFLGYLYNSPAYWSPERGYGAMFVNMHTTVASIQCAIAGILPDHPECEAWLKKGMAYMRRRQLDTWIDSAGRWSGNNVEAPHYALAYDNVLAAMIKAERLGLGDDLYSPAMMMMGEWFAKISTPPDPRFLGLRHIPPIGNTYKFEPSGIFGLLAGVYREHDPKFSAEMQWMQVQQGNQLSPGVGGFFGDLAGYRRILMDDTLPARQPDYRSEWLRGAGAVLRSSYGTPNETLLYLIAGPGATPSRHYDRDQGAITIWNRGVCIADDFGYTGCAPAEDQSLLVSAAAGGGIMDVEALETGEVFDYLQGRQSGWLRQILLVKRPADLAEAPEYFVIHDSLAKPADATWYLWLSAESVSVGSGMSLLVDKKAKAGAAADDLVLEALEGIDADTTLGPATGKLTQKGRPYSVGVGERDVLVNGPLGRQTDIVFAALPPGAAIATERKSRAPAGMDGQGRYLGQNPGTQVGLILQSKQFDSLLTLVFTRLEGEAPPEVTPLADGRGFKIVHGKGTDHVYLSEKPLTVADSEAPFAGAVGVIRTAGGKTARQIRP